MKSIAGLNLRSATTERALVLRLPAATELDGTAVHALLEATSALPPPSTVVLDLRELTDLPAAGARNLVSFVRALSFRAVRCALLVDPARTVARVLATVDHARTLPRFADLEEALLGQAWIAEHGVEELVPRFEALTRTLLGATTVADALQLVVAATRKLVSCADVVSITLRGSDGVFRTPVETDPVATALDEAQYRSGLGPCVEAARKDGPGYAISADLGAERRWPEFAAAATENGLTGVLATELLSASNDEVTGALNIFVRHHAVISDTDRNTALLLATHASLAIAHLRTAELAVLNTAQMRRAIDSRDVIGQAKGILMSRQGIGADEAFALLRQTSQHLNVKLVEVAETLVARRGELEPPVVGA
ncbi:ANTAR domain-containing protein [Streptomyces sp. ID05-26A]|nr:ANTAR domain-containing protein [Streptomyces sp. ID05-26A]